jgi:hypothetical protein
MNNFFARTAGLMLLSQAGCVAIDDRTPETFRRRARVNYPLAVSVEGFGTNPSSVSAFIGRREFPLRAARGGTWEGTASLGACVQGFQLRYEVRYPTVGSTLATAVEPPGATATFGGFLKWVMPDPKDFGCSSDASVFRVNAFGGNRDANPGDGICDSAPSAGAPVCTLAAAINEANFASHPITILVGAGEHATNLQYLNHDIVLEGTEPGVVIIDNVSSSNPSVTVEIRNMTLEGGIFSNGSLRLTEVSVLNRRTASEYDTGVFSNGWLTIERSTIRGNHDGGIEFHGAHARIIDSLIADNSGSWTDMSGGILCAGPGAELELVSSTVTGNQGTFGGVWVKAGCSAKLNNVTIASNTSLPSLYPDSIETLAGGLTVSPGGSVRLANTIIAANIHGSDPANPDCGAGDGGSSVTLESMGHNLVQSLGVCALDPLLGRPDLTDVNANLDELADNGGPTQTRLPLAGSPALGAGSPDPFNDASDAACTHTDQRGESRSAPCDIGAVQASP